MLNLAEAPFCHRRKEYLTASGMYADEDGVMREWMKTSHLVSEDRRRFIRGTLNRFDEDRDNPHGREIRERKYAFANSLESDEKKYGLDWIRMQ